MKKIIRKWYSYYEKEEKWLNSMSAKGFALTKYSLCKYIFEDCEPGEYIYRIELLKHHLSHPESKKYIESMQEIGVEYVSSYLSWVYFRKKATDGPFNICSDLESKIRHYKRIVKMWSIIGFINIILFITNAHSYFTTGEYNTKLPFYMYTIHLFLGSLFIVLCIPYFLRISRLKKENLLQD